MQIPLGPFELRLHPLPLLLYGLLFTLLFSLGQWQLGRYEQKQALNAQLAQRAAMSTLSLAQARSLGMAAQLRPVQVTGELLERVFLHDNRVHQGRAGYDVLAVLAPSDGAEVVLLNLGWLPASFDRSELPQIELPSQGVEVRGLWSFPSKGLSLTSAAESMQLGWPKVIQQIDYPALSEALGRSLSAGVLQAQSASFPLYLARWQPVASDPRKNLSYAVQWFAMAIVLTLLAVKLALKRRRQPKTD